MTAIPLILFAALAAGALILGAAWRWPVWVMLISLSAAALLDLLNIGQDGINVGFYIYFDDIACLLAIVAGLSLVRFSEKSLLDLLPCLALMVLAILSFGRGIGTYGARPAGNSARNLFFFVSPALAIMLGRPVMRLRPSRLAEWLGWAGFCLGLIALLRWAGILSMPQELQTSSASFREVPRVLPSDYAIVVGQACIASVYLPLIARRTQWWWAAAAGFAGITLALQHRSVWTATAAGLAWLAIRNASRISPLRWIVLSLVCVVGLGMVVATVPKAIDSVTALVTNNVRETESSNSTWEWRVKGYQEAVDRLLSSDLMDMTLGPPAGWAVNAGGSFASTHIHSRYVDTFAYYGFGGSTALLVWFWMLAKRAHKPLAQPGMRQESLKPGATFLESLLLSELIYLIPYFGSILEGAVLGLIWVATQPGGLFWAARPLKLAQQWQVRRPKPSSPIRASS